MNAVLEFAEPSEIATTEMRRHRRFSLAEYERMIELGILTKRDKCELIRGKILQKHWDDGSVHPPYHRFSLDQYERMIDAGILTEQDRCELIRGEIIEKMTIGEAHAACVMRLTRLLGLLIRDDAILSVQNHIAVSDSRPEPDLVLLTPRDDFYAESAPRPADILLLIEVADSSFEFDRTKKLPLYAESGVSEYWIANLNNDTVEVYRDPQSDGTYADAHVATLGETLTILSLPGVSITVDQFFTARRAR